MYFFTPQTSGDIQLVKTKEYNMKDHGDKETRDRLVNLDLYTSSEEQDSLSG